MAAQDGRLSRGIIIVPLAAPEDKIDPGGGLDADPTGSAVVGEIAAGDTPSQILVASEVLKGDAGDAS